MRLYKLTRLGKTVALGLIIILMLSINFLSKTISKSNNINALAESNSYSIANKEYENYKQLNEFIKILAKEPLLTINFEANSSSLDSTDLYKLNTFISSAKLINNYKILIEGNISSSTKASDSAFGRKLSFDRANVIKEYLIANGIKESNITVRSNSGLKPLNDNSTENLRSANRRADIYLNLME